MTLTQAEAVAASYAALLAALPALTPPAPDFQERNPFERQDAWLEGGEVVVEWSRYIGCGDYDVQHTRHPLSTLFPKEPA